MSMRHVLGFFLALAVIAAAPAAHAQLFRAYLASDGLDSNPCTLAAPCRLLPAALAAVTNGGEIWMLDSANFNTATVNIAKSVNILAVPGAVGSLVSNGAPALAISTAGLVVALRNIVIVPFPGSAPAKGITMTAASKLTIDQSLFSGLGQFAVEATAGSVKVFDSLFRSNYGAIYVENATGEVAGTKVTDAASYAILAQGSTAGITSVSITDCVLSMGLEGVYAIAGHLAAVVKIWVSRTTVRGYTHALYATGSGVATIDVSASTIVGNNYQHYVGAPGGVIRTRGNNQFADNTTYSGSLTSATLQ